MRRIRCPGTQSIVPVKLKSIKFHRTNINLALNGQVTNMYRKELTLSLKLALSRDPIAGSACTLVIFA